MMTTRSPVLALIALGAVLASSCGGGSSSGGASSGGGDPAAAEIFLNAFTDFACSPGWANRNGGLGRVAYSGSGTCQTVFDGEPGVYGVFLQAQTEADGSSPYSISLNGDVIGSGNFPYAYGSLQCGCSTSQCPDRIVNLGAGIHEIEPGDVIEFFGSDVYPCGEHGSYAKWQGIILVRQ